MSSAGFPLIGPHTEQTCTIDFNFNFVQNSTQSFIPNCMIEFLDWASDSSLHNGPQLDSQIFFCIVFNLQYQYIFPRFQFQNGTHHHHLPPQKSETKNNKNVNRNSISYLNKILNIQTLTSKLYRKWYYMEWWIINSTLNYNQVNHYLKLCNELKLFQ